MIVIVAVTHHGDHFVETVHTLVDAQRILPSDVINLIRSNDYLNNDSADVVKRITDELNQTGHSSQGWVRWEVAYRTR